VDLNIASQVGAVAFSMIQLLGIIAVMSQVAWQVFIIFIPVIGTCIWYQVYHLTSSECCVSYYAETLLNQVTLS
jgi:ATP-binding cassette subfamily C (CFTR/MRP) protein 2